MVNIANLADALTNHIAKCRSAQIVCKAPVAVESWFRIELVSGLVDTGVALEHVQFAYTYPGCRDKGDLAIAMPEFLAVCELKSFVCFADANKINTFPDQLNRLVSLVDSGAISQGLAFCTFYGYAEKRISTLRQKFFDASWTIIGPRPVLHNAPLLFLLASRIRES